MRKTIKRIKGLFIRPKIVKANIFYTQPGHRLAGKRIIVTGGTGALGEAMARRFVAEGANVLITGRNEEKLSKISHEIGCDMLLHDITETASFKPFVAKAIEILGGIDCLVNNAGISLHESFQKVTVEGFDKQIATNLRGPFFLAQNVLSYMQVNNIKGQVLFVSSETGETADIRPYGITKAAIKSLVKGLAYLFLKEEIRINAIAPGVTASGMTGIGEDNLYCSYNPNGRAYLPDEMAEVATFLLSDASGCVSGQILTCNNGKTINARWK